MEACDTTTDRLTTSSGCPIDDKLAVQTVGERGPMLIQDFTFLDEMAHFGQERIPERVVHAKGAGAFGYFEVTHDITQYTKASLFNKIGKKTPLGIRFSTVEDGNWDLVGNNTPIFFIRDPIFFPSFIHTQKRNPVTHLKDANMFWDFISLRPESTHQVSFLFSDRGTPDGYRHMNGYGSHTFKLVNAQGEAVYCKFHMKTDQGIKNMSGERAGEVASSDPDYAIRDLYNAIADGNFPSWSFYLQVMTFDQAEKFRFNPFDLTKVWSQKEYLSSLSVKMVLNRNPTKLLCRGGADRIQSRPYGPRHRAVPRQDVAGTSVLLLRHSSPPAGNKLSTTAVNCPMSARPNNYQRDGPACATDNQTGAPNYFPNSFNGPSDDQVRPVPDSLLGDVRRYRTDDDDNYSQPGVFWREVLTDEDRAALVKNMAGHLKDAVPFIQDRVIKNWSQADSDWGARLRKAVDAFKSVSTPSYLCMPGVEGRKGKEDKKEE
ncbi:catalase [Apostichopus japonicus]|uniref:Catalase n=1 Tax=Stichopus japonicus TaxID=307972 RepID=A0A2G8L933_STIJA|nr:catalase [Apostichopus japonicus]